MTPKTAMVLGVDDLYGADAQLKEMHGLPTEELTAVYQSLLTATRVAEDPGIRQLAATLLKAHACSFSALLTESAAALIMLCSDDEFKVRLTSDLLYHSSQACFPQPPVFQPRCDLLHSPRCPH